MHDVLEGCLPYETKELIKHLIQKRYITLKYVNDQIQHFQYGDMDARNRPTPIPNLTILSSDHSMKQKGIYNLYIIINL